MGSFVVVCRRCRCRRRRRRRRRRCRRRRHCYYQCRCRRHPCCCLFVEPKEVKPDWLTH